MIRLFREILWEHFAEPDFLDFRGEAEQYAGIAVTALDFSDLCGDEEGTSAGHTLARQKSPAAMDDVADECACASTHSHLIGKTSQNTLRDVRVIGRCILKKQSLGVGYVEELLEKLPHTTVSITAPDKLARELFTHRGAGTLVSRGERVNSFSRFEDLEREKLQQLLESCFGRRLTPGYFEKKKCHRVYATEDYRGAAILTSEAGLVYLDKFAVTQKAQGEGLGGSVWQCMRRDNPKVFWRSQTVNPVNAWYFQQSDGSYRTPKWTVFWCGMDGFDEITRCVHTALEMPASLKDHGVEGD